MKSLLTIIVIISTAFYTYSQCPTINAGIDQSICPGETANLSLTYTPVKATTSYTVASTTYSPSSFTTGALALATNIDDKYSALINIGFCFQFYGNTYNQIVVGSNGVISFNSAYASTSSGYSFSSTDAAPSTSIPKNSIMAPYHDIDPSINPSVGNSEVKYQLYGTAPCRYLVVSWSNTPMFSSSCNNLIVNQQIILYETSNIIDIYIKDKPLCSSWNGGLAILGIQNSTGTVATTVAGRNATQWTANNEGWRFSPAGTEISTVQWLQGATVLASTATTTVTPSTTTTYTAKLIVPTCSGNVTFTDDVVINTTSANTPLFTQVTPICSGATLTALPTTSTNGISGTWSPSTMNNTATTTYTFTPSAGQCASTTTMTITVNPIPTVTVNSTSTCTGTSTTIEATPGTPATYSYSWTVPAGATNPGNVASFSSSTAGTYSVIITNTTTGCVSTSASGTLTITPLSVTVNNPTICSSASAIVTATPSTTGTLNYVWTVPSGVTNPGNVVSFSTTIAGTYSVIVTNTANGCSSMSSSGTVTANPVPTVTVNSPSTCSGTATSITATPGSAATYSYAWTVPSGVTAPGNVATFNSTTAGTYSVIITNTTTGCESSSASGTLTINPLSATVNNSSICAGSPATITATPNTTGTFSYSWTIPAGATAPGDVATFTTTTSGTYSVIVTNTVTGCTSISASGTATINPLPTVTVNSSTVCSGVSSTLTATPGSAATYTYAWTVPSGVTAPGNVSSITSTVGGTYSVIITNTSTGCSSNSASGTITLNTAPTVSVNSTSTCSGIATAITATPGTAGTYNYSWTVPSGATAPGNVATFNTSTAGNYSVIITDPATTCSSLSATGTLTVNPLPTVTVNNPSICAGNNATLTATPGTAGTYSYAWTVPTGASAPGNVSNFTTNTAGTYSVIITTTSTGCISSSASGTATVNPIPTVTVNNPSICAGSNATFIATSGSAATYTYAWTVPTGATAPGNVATFTTNTAGTYSLIITNTTTGCSSTSVSGIATINSIPTVNVNISTICSGSNATVTATPISTGIYDYNWTVPNGVTNPGNTSTFNSSINGNYSVVIIDQATFCSSVLTTGNVTVVNLPTANITGSTTICEGTSSIVNFTGTPNSILSFNIDGGTTQTIQLNAQGNATTNTGILNSTKIYNLTSVALTTAPFCVATLNSSITITIENAPTITFTSDKISGCTPLVVNFTNTTQNSKNCVWSFGDGSTVSNCGTVSHTFIQPGCYDISLTAESPNGCSANITTNDLICIDAIPVAAFNPSPDIISNIDPVSTMDNISTGATSFEWTFGDGTSSTETSPEHMFEIGESTFFNINLIAISDAGCKDTTSVIVRVNEELIYYIPNTFTPDGDKFNQVFLPVFTKGYDPYDYKLTIFNRWGEILFESNDASVGWDGTYNGKIVQDGIYSWKINFKLKTFDDRKELSGHINLLR